MSRWILASAIGLVFAALYVLHGPGVLDAAGEPNVSSHSQSTITVMYGDLVSTRDATDFTEEADPEDGESGEQGAGTSTAAASRADHSISVERLRSFRPDRPPRFAHLG
jgi:hypothetical protein